MRIAFERTGGFAGMRLAVELNTGKLSQEEAQELEQMIQSASFFDLPDTITSPTPEADRFFYKVTVRQGFRKHTVEMSESATPEAVQPLLDRLVAAARTSPQI